MGYYYNISGFQGSTLLLNLSATDSTGAYINFNGYSVSGYCKEKYSSTGKLFDLNVTIIAPESGYIGLSGAANDLASVPAGIYVYNIEAKQGDYIFKPLQGYFILFPESANL